MNSPHRRCIRIKGSEAAEDSIWLGTHADPETGEFNFGLFMTVVMDDRNCYLGIAVHSFVSL